APVISTTCAFLLLVARTNALLRSRNIPLERALRTCGRFISIRATLFVTTYRTFSSFISTTRKMRRLQLESNLALCRRFENLFEALREEADCRCVLQRLTCLTTRTRNSKQFLTVSTVTNIFRVSGIA